MKQLFIASGIGVGVFYSVSYMLTNLATSNIHWSQFMIIVITLPVLFILLSVFILKFASGIEEENFMQLVKIILKFIHETLKFLFERKDKI
ncbi:hypothetical protein SAMN05518672_115124 [Chitinophaga sp. CF118]|uniref:hypothetical protein n=1 Tax=Chitinophaga sp. CF118 TaxID=1884367 RepID=UPI0008DF212E|nr:hypothetical protein [Chitinophaga sp. CF118]SFF08398.1 hypothetical protein SAMN05518672_115124 [Chitinophaga sp. CF118]